MKKFAQKFSRARRSGFTLVELLIVIMIIAILAGMMMLATGSATDTANATKIINDLRVAKSTALLIYMDNNQSWDWATGTDLGSTEDITKSFDRYMDKPLFSNGQYKLNFGEAEINNAGGGTLGGTTGGSKRKLIGFTVNGLSDNNNLKEKLAGNAARSGIYTSSGALYEKSDSTGTVYMVLN